MWSLEIKTPTKHRKNSNLSKEINKHTKKKSRAKANTKEEATQNKAAEAKLKEAAHARKMPQKSIMMTRAFARVSVTQKRTLPMVDITKQCKTIDSTNSRVDFFT